MSHVIALVCEGPVDHRVVKALVNRLIDDAVEWVRDQHGGAAALVRWRGHDPDTEYVQWRDVKALARGLNEPVTNKQFAGGLPQSQEALTARKALLLFDRIKRTAHLDAVILQRDHDGDDIRQSELDLARGEVSWPFAVVVGVAEPTIESWILAGFVADAGEQSNFDDLCRLLGFNPCRQGERLSRLHADHARRPKAVVDAVTRDSRDRERRCYEHTPFPTLEANGAANGLAAFFAEVRGRLLPGAFNVR